MPLSNDGIKSRIIDISANILKQVMEELKATPFPFSVQLDESTDIPNRCQFLVFARHVHADTMKEEFLFCKTFSQDAKATDILEMIHNFFANKNFNGRKKLVVCVQMELLQCLAKQLDLPLCQKKSTANYCYCFYIVMH